MRLYVDTRERLKRLRVARGWSQSQLAERLNRPQPWVSRREVGTTPWRPDEVAEVAEVFGWKAETILLPPGEATHDLMDALQDLEPPDVPAVISLIRSLPHMDEATKALVLAQLDVISQSYPRD